jgi:hypothetical protein
MCRLVGRVCVVDSNVLVWEAASLFPCTPADLVTARCKFSIDQQDDDHFQSDSSNAKM